MSKAERAGVGQAFHEEVSRVLERRECAVGMGAATSDTGSPSEQANASWGRSVLYSNRNASDRFCCAAHVALDGFDACRLSGAMHAFVGAVLLRAARVNALVRDAEPHPPDVQVREPVDRARRERDAVVGANRPRQPVLTKGPLEHGPRDRGFRREHAVATEQVARVLIRDRQRVAVHAVARPELPFEVRCPQIVRRCRRDRSDAGMLVRPPAPPTPHQAAAREQFRGRARGRPIGDLGMPTAQHFEQLPRAPIGMQPAELTEQLRRGPAESPSGTCAAAGFGRVRPRLPSSANRPSHLYPIRRLTP